MMMTMTTMLLHWVYKHLHIESRLLTLFLFRNIFRSSEGFAQSRLSQWGLGRLNQVIDFFFKIPLLSNSINQKSMKIQL
jgi:hypothetical protein